jgi:hypothetical protein
MDRKLFKKFFINSMKQKYRELNKTSFSYCLTGKIGIKLFSSCYALKIIFFESDFELRFQTN